MSENSGGSIPSQCKSCHRPLLAPDVKFCGNCGVPQKEMKKCVHCGEEIPGSDRFCSHCGGEHQTQPLPRKQCLLCGTSLSSNAQNCVFCSAPQDPRAMVSVTLKYCVNNQVCDAALIYSSTLCYKCKSHQPMPTPIELLIPAELPNTQMVVQPSQPPIVSPSVTFMEQNSGGQLLLPPHVVSDPSQTGHVILFPQQFPSPSSNQYQVSQLVNTLPNAAQFSSYNQSQGTGVNGDPNILQTPLNSQSCVISHSTSTQCTVSDVPAISDQEKAIHGAKRQLDYDEHVTTIEKRHKPEDSEDGNNKDLVYTEKGGAVVCQQVPNDSVEPKISTNDNNEQDLPSHTTNTETAKNVDKSDTNDGEVSLSTGGKNNTKHTSEYEKTTLDSVVPTLADIVKRRFPQEANTLPHQDPLSQQEEVMQNSHVEVNTESEFVIVELPKGYDVANSEQGLQHPSSHRNTNDQEQNQAPTLDQIPTSSGVSSSPAVSDEYLFYIILLTL